MNRVYKVIWLKAKNSYVVVSELAKRYSKASKSLVLSRAFVAGVLASLLGFGSYVSPVSAMEIVSESMQTDSTSNVVSEVTDSAIVNQIKSAVGLTNSTDTSLSFIVKSDSTGSFYFLTRLYLPNYDSAVVKLSLQEALDLGIVNNGDLSLYAFQHQDNLTSVNLGSGATSSNANSVALGFNAQANVADSVAIGANSIATESNTVSVGNSTIKRRITNVADGVNDSDVPTMKQLNQLAGVKVLAGNNIDVSESFDTNGIKQFTVSANIDTGGIIENANTGLVTGNSVYNEVHVNSDGTYVKSANTVSQNLSALDAAIINFSSENTGTPHFIGIKGGNSSSVNYNGEGAVGSSAMAIGVGAHTGDQATYAIAIGNNAYGYNRDAIVIGRDAVGVGAWGDANPIAIGKHAQTDDGIAIGTDTFGQAGGIIIGSGAKTTSDTANNYSNGGAIAIGGGATYNSKYLTWVDDKFVEGAIAIGLSSQVDHYGIAIGYFAKSIDGFALGDRAYAYNRGIAIGFGASTSNKDGEYSGIAVGTSAQTYGGITIGRKAISGIDSVAIGLDSRTGNRVYSGGYYNQLTTYHPNSVAIGSHSWADSKNSVAVGSKSYASTDSTAVGRQASAKNNSVAIGNDSIATGSNVVSFGHTSSDLVPFVPYGTVGSSSERYSSSLTRRLINVSNGMSASDAATVAQTLDLRAGNNVSLQYSSSGSNSYGQPIRIINVNPTGAVTENNTGIVTGGVVFDSLKKFNISAGDNVTLRDLYSPPDIRSIASIVNAQSSPSDKTSALSNALNTYSSVIQGDALAALGVTNSEMSDFMGSIYNDTLYGNMTQERFDEIMQMNLTLSESVLTSRQINVKKDGLVVSGNTGIVTGDTVYNAIQDALQDVGSVDVANKANIDAENVTDAQAWADKLGLGIVDTEDTRLVTASAVASETRLATDGNYVLSNKTAGENISLLDTSLKALDTIAVKYDGEDFATATLVGTNGTKLTNLKQGTLSASSTDAVTGAQLFATNQNIAGFATDINRNKESIREMNTSVSAALDSVSSTSLLVDTINSLKADASLNNLTEAGRQIIATAAANAVQEYMASASGTNVGSVPPVAPMMMSSASNTLNITDAGNGSLHVGEGSSVNGTSSIAIGVGNQVNANNSGAFGDPSIINADASYVLGNDDTINTGATGSFIVGNDSVSDAKGGLSLGSNNKLDASAENSVLLGNNAIAHAQNSVALGSGSVVSEENTVSLGNASLKRKLTNVKDGTLSSDSSDAVTGKQLYATNQKVSSLETTVANKANADASNIDEAAWAEKLGVGKVEYGNGGLVKGGEVFDAIMMTRNDTVGYDSATNSLRVGGSSWYDSVDVVDVSKSDGAARVIQGVATNPNDPHSAANVGYVNAVNESVMQSVNNQLEHTNRRMEKVGASAAAMSALTPASFEGDERWSLAAAVGNYRSASAGAVGAFYKPTEHIMMNVRGSFGTDENMVAAGVAVSLNKGDVPGVTKRQLVHKIETMEQNHKQELAQMNQSYQAAFAEMRQQMEAMANTIHDLRQKVDK